MLCRAGLDETDELCATDKTVRVHAEFDLALERVAGIVCRYGYARAHRVGRKRKTDEERYLFDPRAHHAIPDALAASVERNSGWAGRSARS